MRDNATPPENNASPTQMQTTSFLFKAFIFTLFEIFILPNGGTKQLAKAFSLGPFYPHNSEVS